MQVAELQPWVLYLTQIGDCEGGVAFGFCCLVDVAGCPLSMLLAFGASASGHSPVVWSRLRHVQQ